MQKTKKRVVGISIIFVLLLLLFAGSLVPGYAKNHVSAASYFSAERYTESDNLLQSDGTESDKTIRAFAKEVKSASANTYFPELTQVIPREYFETTAKNATFQYFGKEYGFYLVKTGNIFDLLLIDFIFESDKNLPQEFSVKIEPILQQSFEKLTTDFDGSYIILKNEDESYRYYVANPRFATILLNENALNYGNEGYSKQKDDGLIIQQMRLNCSKIEYKTEKDLWEARKNYFVNSIVDIAIASIDKFNIISDIRNRIEYEDELFEQKREKNIPVGNEANIYSNLTKDGQLNSLTPFFSRTSLHSIQGEVVLSGSDESFAEAITVLNATNYRSRLFMLCEFDIYRRKDGFSSMELVAKSEGHGSANEISCYKEQVIYPDAAPQPTLTQEQITGRIIPLYCLPNGEQIFRVAPTYSGEYNFRLSDYFSLSVDGVARSNTDGVYRVFLSAGQVHKIVVRNTSGLLHTTQSMICDIAERDTLPISVRGKDTYIRKYRATENGVFKVATSNGNVAIEVLNHAFQPVEYLTDSGTANERYCSFASNGVYYFVLRNGLSQSVAVNVTVVSPLAIRKNENVSVTESNKFATVQNEQSQPSYYRLTVNSGTAKVVCGGEVTLVASASKNEYIFSLQAQEQCYIIFQNPSANVTARMEIDKRYYRWKVDGKILEESTVKLYTKDKTGYSVELVSWVDGKDKPIDTRYVLPPNSDCVETLQYGTLTLKSVAESDAYNSKTFILYTFFAPDYILTVVVNEYSQVTLDHKNETGRTETVYGRYGSQLPNVTVPTRNKYRFEGYYSGENGSGKRYYNAQGVGVTWDKSGGEIRLYAKWTRVAYEVRIKYPGLTASGTQTLTIGEKFMINDLLKRPGYDFEGLYSGQNGTGDCYVKGRLIVSKGADQYGQMRTYYSLIQEPQLAWQIANDSQTLYVNWKPLEFANFKVEMRDTEGVLKGHGPAVTVVHAKAKEFTAPALEGYVFQEWRTNRGATVASNPYLFTPQLDRTGETNEVTPTLILRAIYKQDECVAEGTLITLADGTRKPVELLTGNERLLVWNLHTGRFDSAPILFIDREIRTTYSVLNLSFSDGTVVKVIGEHGFWDCNLNRYVYLRQDNAHEYLGHVFKNQAEAGLGEVTLTGATVTQEVTVAYSPVTAEHLCYFVDGILSMPGGIEGIFNLFEVDAETMRYDEALMAADIEKYGIFTYEEFSAFVPVNEEMFEVFNGKYLKIAIGKGLVTEEKLMQLAERYAPFFAEDAV